MPLLGSTNGGREDERRVAAAGVSSEMLGSISLSEAGMSASLLRPTTSPSMLEFDA